MNREESLDCDGTQRNERELAFRKDAKRKVSLPVETKFEIYETLRELGSTTNLPIAELTCFPLIESNKRLSSTKSSNKRKLTFLGYA